MEKTYLTGSSFLLLSPPPQFISNMMTTEMYLKYKEEEEISPHTVSMVRFKAHTQYADHVGSVVCPLQ